MELPPGDEIVQKWIAGRKVLLKKSPKEEKAVQSNQIVPEELKLFEPLPPSLMPPPSGGWQFSCDDLAEWG